MSGGKPINKGGTPQKVDITSLHACIAVFFQRSECPHGRVLDNGLRRAEAANGYEHGAEPTHLLSRQTLSCLECGFLQNLSSYGQNSKPADRAKIKIKINGRGYVLHLV